MWSIFFCIVHFIRRNIYDLYIIHSIYPIRKNQYVLICTIYVEESSRQFRAESVLAWCQRAPFINQPPRALRRAQVTKRKRISGHATMVRPVEKKKEKKNENEKFTLGRAESGTFSAGTAEAPRDVCACAWRTISGERSATAPTSTRLRDLRGASSRQCDIAIRLIRAGYHRRSDMVVGRGSAVVLHVNVHRKM